MAGMLRRITDLPAGAASAISVSARYLPAPPRKWTRIRMSTRTASLITWGGSLLILGAGFAAVALNVAYGETIFAARLIAGFSGCL